MKKLYAKCISKNCSTVKLGEIYEYKIENNIYKWICKDGSIDYFGGDTSKIFFLKQFKPINQIIQIY